MRLAATSGAKPHLLVLQQAVEQVAAEDAGGAGGAEERAVAQHARRLQLEVP